MNPTDAYFFKGRWAPILTEVRDAVLPDPVDVTGTAIASGDLVAFASNFPAGTYVRNGPNPEFKPRSRFHWFEGDGMLHAVTLAPTNKQQDESMTLSATYTNRWVQTESFRTNRAYGRKYGTLFFYSIILDLQGMTSIASMLFRN